MITLLCTAYYLGTMTFTVKDFPAVLQFTRSNEKFTVYLLEEEPSYFVAENAKGHKLTVNLDCRSV